MKYDFSGYATKNNIVCADGLIIRKDAFKDCNGKKVPIVWHHLRDDPSNILGYATLENRPDGVYAYGMFNNTEKGQIAKQLVEHGDIEAMSIHANQIQKQNGRNVIHGMIREVSLVVAGANPGATIETLGIEHDGIYDEVEDELIIRMSDPIEIYHSEENIQNGGESMAETIDHAENGKTIKEIFDSLNEEQKNAVYAMIGYALSEEDEDVDQSNEEGDEIMHHNIFDKNDKTETLTHDEMTAILSDAKRFGSLRDSVIEHGINNIDILFPEAKTVTPTPTMIDRDQTWVNKLWNGFRKVPFSRIKSVTADLTKDEARAKGYIKGKKKIEEQFSLLKRVTTPTTVYKKQGLDRDDLVDITDFDVVGWMKIEMRQKLNEELARAALVGDGRLASSDDKINEQNIRPIYTDDDMYTIKYNLGNLSNKSRDEVADALIDGANMARVDYKGSGSPTLYIDSRSLTAMLLAKDKIGHRLYKTTAELATAMRVSDIVEVPVMENLTRKVTVEGTSGSTSVKTMKLHGIIVNPADYGIGADRGGQIAFFDDFDIDYNRMKYLIETRCSGALQTPYSAIVLESEVTESATGGTGEAAG